MAAADVKMPVEFHPRLRLLLLLLLVLLSSAYTVIHNNNNSNTTTLQYHSTTHTHTHIHTLQYGLSSHAYAYIQLNINARIQLTRRSSTHYCFLPCPALPSSLHVSLPPIHPHSSVDRLSDMPGQARAHPLPSTSTSNSPPGPQRLSRPSSLSFPVACPAACQNEPLRLRLRINGPRKAGAAGLADGLAIHLPQLR